MRYLESIISWHDIPSAALTWLTSARCSSIFSEADINFILIIVRL